MLATRLVGRQLQSERETMLKIADAVVKRKECVIVCDARESVA